MGYFVGEWVSIDKLSRLFKGRLEVRGFWTPFLGKDYCIAIIRKRLDNE